MSALKAIEEHPGKAQEVSLVKKDAGKAMDEMDKGFSAKSVSGDDHVESLDDGNDDDRMDTGE